MIASHTWANATHMKNRGYGWEDICARLQIKNDADQQTIRRMVIGRRTVLQQAQQRQEVRADTS